SDVRSLEVSSVGGTAALFAGGFFGGAGGAPAAHIARWDGTSWSPLDGGTNGFVVSALEEFDDGGGVDLYAGGDFTQVDGLLTFNRVARWNGAFWSRLRGGLDGSVNALRAYDDGNGPALYAGGSFTRAVGAAFASNIARWDGTT